MSDTPIYVPHIERGPHPEVIAAIREEGFEPVPFLTPQADPYSYSSAIRQWWREGKGFVIVEQDARPPAGAIRSYLDCPEPVCSRPHNCRRDGVMGSLACVKFSSHLIAEYPDFADAILARVRPEVYWQMGLLFNRPYKPGCAAPRGLRNALVAPEAYQRFGPFPGPLWPTTQEWPHSDTVIFEALAALGVPTHYHTEPSVCYPDPAEHFPGVAQTL